MTISFEIWGLLALSMSTGLVAGVFLTFSDFVMPALQATAPAAGTQAMQIINRKVYRTLFMVLFIGLIPFAIFATLAGVFFLEGPVAGYLIAAGLLYVIGVFIASVVGNIPMNQRLEAMPEGGSQAQAYWPAYVRGWVRWNHLRWVSALGASTCYAVAALLMAAAH